MMGSSHLQQRTITDYEFNTGAEERPCKGIRRLASWFSRNSGRMTRLTSWIKRRVSWSDGAEQRGQRALKILEDGDQIEYVSPGCYSVQSQSQPGLFYTVNLSPSGDTCECPYHKYRRARCKHILSVCAHVADKNAITAHGGMGGAVTLVCQSSVL